MSTSLDSLVSIYKARPGRAAAKGKKLPKRKKPVLLQPSNSSHTLQTRLGRNPCRDRQVQRPKNHSIEPKTSSLSVDHGMKRTAQYILNRSLDEDMQRLENLTVRNSSMRQHWLDIQQSVLVLGLNEQLKTIAETEELASEYFPENIYASPVDVLVQKYEAHHRNHSLAVLK